MGGTGELWAPRTVDDKNHENPLSLCPCPVQSRLCMQRNCGPNSDPLEFGHYLNKMDL